MFPTMSNDGISIHTNCSEIITSCRSSNLQARIIFVNTEIQNCSFRKTSNYLFFFNYYKYLKYLFIYLLTYLLTTYFSFFFSKKNILYSEEVF